MVEISVIVPAYNVENYINECLDSIRNQTFSDIEVICINDGSSDRTLEILNEYESKDSRFRIFTQENKGLSATRNVGLDNAQGKYIYFIDSDDYLELNALETLYNIAEEKSLDCVLFKLINFDDATGEKFPTEYYEMEFLKEAVGDNVFSHEDIEGQMFNVSVSVPGKLFKSDLIGEIRFVEGIIFEDNPFFVEILFNAKRMFFLDEYLYYRRVRENSIITSSKNFMDFITVSNLLIDLTKQYGYYDEYKGPLFNKTIKNMFIRFVQTDDDYKKEYFAKMKDDFLSKKDEYDHDEVFQNSDDRLKEIYYKCIEAETPKELELYLKVFDLQTKLDRTNELKSQINRDKYKLLHRSQELSVMLNELAYENKQLKSRN